MALWENVMVLHKLDFFGFNLMGSCGLRDLASKDVVILTQ